MKASDPTPVGREAGPAEGVRRTGAAGRRRGRERGGGPPAAGKSAAGKSAAAMWRRERAWYWPRRATAGLLALAAALSCGAGALRVVFPRSVPGPGWAPLVAGAGLAVAAFGSKPARDPDRWARGAAGELATEQLLATLSGRRWAVLHDVALPGSRANVDHLVIGPTGVWVIDSKARRAKLKAGWRSARAGRTPLPTGPVRFEAALVSEVLRCPVKAVVAVHGRGLPRRGRVYQGVRVLPAPRLVRHVTRGLWLRPQLGRAEVRHLAQLAKESLGPPRPS